MLLQNFFRFSSVCTQYEERQLLREITPPNEIKHTEDCTILKKTRVSYGKHKQTSTLLFNKLLIRSNKSSYLIKQDERGTGEVQTLLLLQRRIHLCSIFRPLPLLRLLFCLVFSIFLQLPLLSARFLFHLSIV